MIRNKKELIKKIQKIGNQKIEQGIQFKNLAGSIETRKEEKTLKEWLEFSRKVLDLENQMP